MQELFDITSLVLSKTLDLISLRHNFIASNIANIDTPGYKSKELKFEHQLRSALKTMGNESLLIQTHTRHFPMEGEFSIIPEIVQEDSSSGGNGNSVDVDQEMTKLAENILLYNASSEILSRKLGMLRVAVNEGRR